jgi:hypothetical protein
MAAADSSDTLDGIDAYEGTAILCAASAAAAAVMQEGQELEASPSAITDAGIGSTGSSSQLQISIMWRSGS